MWQLASADSQSQRIARAIDWLKTRFAQTLRVDDLAEHVQMRPSRFHHHFKQLAAMSPLQFEKWLRLDEARRLMLADNVDASTTSFNVGYESASRFSREYSREYSRQLGLPPMRDIDGLKQPGVVTIKTTVEH